jgi:hypothetical protein
MPVERAMLFKLPSVATLMPKPLFSSILWPALSRKCYNVMDILGLFSVMSAADSSGESSEVVRG